MPIFILEQKCIDFRRAEIEAESAEEALKIYKEKGSDGFDWSEQEPYETALSWIGETGLCDGFNDQIVKEWFIDDQGNLSERLSAEDLPDL